MLSIVWKSTKIQFYSLYVCNWFEAIEKWLVSQSCKHTHLLFKLRKQTNRNKVEHKKIFFEQVGKIEHRQKKLTNFKEFFYETRILFYYSFFVVVAHAKNQNENCYWMVTSYLVHFNAIYFRYSFIYLFLVVRICPPLAASLFLLFDKFGSWSSFIIIIILCLCSSIILLLMNQFYSHILFLNT